MKTFHIRKPRAPGPHIRKTYCGAAPTPHDIGASWDAIPVGDYVPCEACVAARDADRKAAKAKGGAA